MQDAAIADVSWEVAEYEVFAAKLQQQQQQQQRRQQSSRTGASHAGGSEMAPASLHVDGKSLRFAGSKREELLGEGQLRAGSFVQTLEEERSQRGASTSGGGGRRSAAVSYVSLIEETSDGAAGGHDHPNFSFAANGKSSLSQSLLPSLAKLIIAADAGSVGLRSTSSRVGMMQFIEACQLKWLLLLLPLLYVLYQLVRVYFSVWPGFWQKLSFGLNNGQHEGIMAGFFCALVILRLFTDYIVYKYGALDAAQRIRRSLCDAICNAPITFFMTENIGKIGTVFSRDLVSLSESFIDAVQHHPSAPPLDLKPLLCIKRAPRTRRYTTPSFTYSSPSQCIAA